MNTTLITWGRCEKQFMLFSNLHSFHFAKKLQNATALPAHVYRKISNRRSINRDANIPYVNIPPEQTQKPVRMKRAGQAEPSSNSTASPFDELREPVIIEGRATRKPSEPSPPVINNVVETKPKRSVKFDSPSKPPEHPGQRTEKAAEAGLTPDLQANNTQTPPTQKPHRNYARPGNPHVKVKPLPPPQHHPRINKRNVWKPGHGPIEKVDKLTGEIVHLVEESIDNEKIKAISSI